MPSPPLSHDWLGRRKSVLNVSFDGEDAHGSGVTREFYTLVMRELRDKRLGLWRDLAREPAASASEHSESRFVFAPRGLFPAPLPADADGAARVIDLVVLAGRATAKALEDGHRDIDLPIGETFAKLVLGEPVTLGDVAAVEPDMEATTRVLEAVLCAVEESEVHGDTAAADWAREQCEMLCLTWAKGSTPLVPGGDDTDVTIDNVRGFCRALVDAVVVAPAIAHATAFRHGFASVADVSRLRMFTAAEFVAVVSDVSTSWASQAHLWEPESIRQELTFHDSSQFRFERSDPTITAFVEALSALSPADKRLFLEFATASPRLPEDGFAGLRPKRLQINRRNPKPGHTADDEAIFCRVCTSELSLPEYSSPEVLRKRLHEAIHSIADGLGGFRQHA
jgi:E3 ubiquitin-protein ligase TRIP12